MDIHIIEQLPKEVFIKFRKDQLNYVRKLYKLDDQRLRESIKLLRSWVQKQDYFNKKDIPDIHFEKLLITSKGSVERAKERLEKLCTFKTIWPQYFSTVDVNTLRNEFKKYTSILLPEMTEDGARVSLSKVFTNDLPADILEHFTKYAVITCEYAIRHDYPSGFVIILDYRDVNVFELLAFGTRLFSQLQECLATLMDGYGMRMKGIHIITPSKAADALITFVKQILSNKVASRLHVHANTKTLYEFIPKKILPSDLGGHAASLSEMHDEFLKELGSKEHIEHMTEAQSLTIDKAKKPNGRIDYYGIPGSFRSLNMD